VTAPAPRTGHLGILVPVVSDLYFAGILGGAADGAYERELRLVLLPTRHEHAREASLLDGLKQGTDGAVVLLPEASSGELSRALNDAYPIVVVDPLLPLDHRIPSVLVANRSGADQAMAHLLALGHRRIAAITGPPGWVATEDRRAGYREALAGAGIPFVTTLEVEADFDAAAGAAAAAQLLDLPEPPTAIFAFSDAIAIGALRSASERGLRVPQDLSIVGFDDIEHATVVSPTLTTVRQPLAEMGRTAVGLLTRLLEHGHLETLHIELPTRLVIRDSTAAPRSA
jgi:LacI family transcriptional regulator